jgi:hypothetical protein
MSTEQNIEADDDQVAAKWAAMTDEERYGASTEEVVEIREWLEIRRQEGQNIDPETAEFTFWWTQVLDPYGVYGNLPEECDCVGRSYFACAPGSKMWVWFGDLPEETEKRVWERISSGDLQDYLAEKFWHDLTA